MSLERSATKFCLLAGQKVEEAYGGHMSAIASEGHQAWLSAAYLSSSAWSNFKLFPMAELLRLLSRGCDCSEVHFWEGGWWLGIVSFLSPLETSQMLGGHFVPSYIRAPPLGEGVHKAKNLGRLAGVG